MYIVNCDCMPNIGTRNELNKKRSHVTIICICVFSLRKNDVFRVIAPVHHALV